LLFERHELAVDEPRRAPRVLQQFEGEKSGNLRFVWHECGERPGEPNRLVRQVDSRVRVPPVEEQVEHGEHPAQPPRQQVRRRHPVRNVRVIDLAFRPHQSLRHRRLRHEERARDLGGG